MWSTKQQLQRSGEDIMFTVISAGFHREDAVALIVNGYAKEVLESAADGVCCGSAETSGDFA